MNAHQQARGLTIGSDSAIPRWVRVLVIPTAVFLSGLAYIIWKLGGQMSAMTKTQNFVTIESVALMTGVAAFTIWFVHRRLRPASVYLGVVFLQLVLTWWCALAATQ